MKKKKIDEYKNLLMEEGVTKLKELADMDVTDENYASSVNNVTKLTECIVEMEKAENDRKAKLTNTLADVGLKVAGGVAATGMMIVCLKFEQTGAITTKVGRFVSDTVFKIFKI